VSKAKVIQLQDSKKLTDVQKRSANSALAEGVDADDEAKYLEDLRGVVWKEAGTGSGSWKSLAEKAGLADMTVRRFATGETKRPTLFTIRRMLAALNYRLTWQKIPRQRKK